MPKIRPLNRRLCGCAALLFLLAAAALAPVSLAGSQPPEERISLNVKSRPLGEVLGSITQSTGREFILDDSWRSYPVSALVEEAPLYIGLKRVLSGLNHAIVYRSDGRIRILIYETAATGRPAQSRAESGPAPAAALPARPAAAPLPDFQPIGGDANFAPPSLPAPRVGPGPAPAAGETQD